MAFDCHKVTVNSMILVARASSRGQAVEAIPILRLSVHVITCCLTPPSYKVKI